MMLSYLLIEPSQAIKAAFLMLANWKTHFNFYNLNPTAITEEQSKKHPILLIHGNYHNQSAWLCFAKKLKEDGGLGPVYTVNLPNGDITEKDFEIIDNKIRQIKEQYQKHSINNPTIDLVGHSRGGDMAVLAAWGPKHHLYNIGIVITLGSVMDQEKSEIARKLDPHFDDRLYEIVGKNDMLVTEQSLCPSSHKAEIESGHVGLLYSLEASKCMINWLKGSLG